MKIFSSSNDYNYSFPTVTLAYFLRYPNPYSTHVLSTDVLERYIDPTTHRLHTTRLHLKRSKVPAGILAFTPKSWVGKDGANQSFILEKSVVDVKEGWMETESRNMEWTGVLSVVERQKYQDLTMGAGRDEPKATSCKTVVTFTSKFGEKMRKRRKLLAEARAANTQHADGVEDDDAMEEVPEKQGWLASLRNTSVQRTIELLGANRSKQAVTNGAEGMKVVLARLREGGIRNVLDGMRHDRLMFMGGDETWQGVWKQGQATKGDDDNLD